MSRLLTFLYALLIFAAPAAFGADLNGKWNFHVKFMLHSGDPWFQFQQDGDKLTGMYHGHFGDEALTGTVKGDAVQFTISDSRGTATYSGTVTGDTIKGTAKYPFPLGSGKFQGQRSK